MKWFPQFLLSVFPTLRIPPKWRDLWNQKERSAYLLGARVVSGLSVLGYLLHILYVDRVLGLTPIGDWRVLRGVAILFGSAAFFVSFLGRFNQGWMLKVPLATYGLVCCMLQGIAMNWLAEVDYAYSIIIPVISTVGLRLTVPASMLYMIATYGVEYQAWVNRPHEFPLIISAAIVGLVTVAFFRSRMGSEVAAFLAENKNLESQRKLIEAEMELNEQIRSFLPKEIYRRFQDVRSTNNMTALQAMDEVLRIKEKKVTCLHSDIRGYTLQSRENSFLFESAVPNIKVSTDIVEGHGGIPKLIGDLVFAYFDQEPDRALLHSILCGFELEEMNIELNLHVAEKDRVVRFVLISHGEALVGNIGGSEGSRDITVLGNPANILSRIDPLTKDPQVRAQIGNSTVILTSGAALALQRLIPSVELKEIDLKSMGKDIRDFPHETKICLMLNSPETIRAIHEVLSKLNDQKGTLSFESGIFLRNREALSQ